MTAFSPAQLPASVDTVEKLAAWSTAILAELNKDVVATEGTNSTQPAATSNVFFVPSGPPQPEHRVIARISILLENDWRSGPLWENVSNLSNAVIPDHYTP